MFARIVGTGACLPAQCVSNDVMVERLAKQGIETSDRWILERTGIAQRYVADPDQKTSDLAVEAVRFALLAAHTDKAEIDLLILATTTPDQIFPATACIIQHKLGCGGFPAFDIQAVCAGFVFALNTAAHYICAGAARCAVVVGAETMTSLIDWQDRKTCVLFGDGAGAVVLKPDVTPGILQMRVYSNGQYQDALGVKARVYQGKLEGHPWLTMEGQRVFKHAVTRLAIVSKEVLKAAQLEVANLNWLIPHQANLRIIKQIADELGLPMDRVLLTVGEHGNTSAASIPMALDKGVRDGRIQAGQLLLLNAIGGGLSWGAILLHY